jgi:transposase
MGKPDSQNARKLLGSQVKKIFSKLDRQFFFLPPYSPDLNPIELVWAILKKKIQGLLEKTKGITLANAMNHAFQLISNDL